MGFHECVEIDVGELLKTSTKTLRNEDLAECMQSTTEGEKLSTDDAVCCGRVDFTTRGLGEVPGEMDEALSLRKTGPTLCIHCEIQQCSEG